MILAVERVATLAWGILAGAFTYSALITSGAYVSTVHLLTAAVAFLTVVALWPEDATL